MRYKVNGSAEAEMTDKSLLGDRGVDDTVIRARN